MAVLRSGMAPVSVWGCPSTVNGPPKILSNRSAERIFGGPPLSGGASAPPPGRTKGQAGACLDRTRAILCAVRRRWSANGRVIKNGTPDADRNSSVSIASCNCCQHCCQDHSQLPTRNDKLGISAQHAAAPGQFWTVRPCLESRWSLMTAEVIATPPHTDPPQRTTVPRIGQ